MLIYYKRLTLNFKKNISSRS